MCWGPMREAGPRPWCVGQSLLAEECREQRKGRGGGVVSISIGNVYDMSAILQACPLLIYIYISFYFIFYFIWRQVFVASRPTPPPPHDNKARRLTLKSQQRQAPWQQRMTVTTTMVEIILFKVATQNNYSPLIQVSRYNIKTNRNNRLFMTRREHGPLFSLSRFG